MGNREFSTKFVCFCAEVLFSWQGSLNLKTLYILFLFVQSIQNQNIPFILLQIDIRQLRNRQIDRQIPFLLSFTHRENSPSDLLHRFITNTKSQAFYINTSPFRLYKFCFENVRGIGIGSKTMECHARLTFRAISGISYKLIKYLKQF